jgi:hypothetical protein
MSSASAWAMGSEYSASDVESALVSRLPERLSEPS